MEGGGDQQIINQVTTIFVAARNLLRTDDILES
jgi:hypothetical protein